MGGGCSRKCQPSTILSDLRVVIAWEQWSGLRQASWKVSSSTARISGEAAWPVAVCGVGFPARESSASARSPDKGAQAAIAAAAEHAA